MFSVILGLGSSPVDGPMSRLMIIVDGVIEEGKMVGTAELTRRCISWQSGGSIERLGVG